MYLAVRTDSEEALICLVANDSKIIESKKWHAGRELASGLLYEIDQMLKSAIASNSSNAIDGIIFYKGPGSFTGLRIGATVCSTLAYAKSLPIAYQIGDNWISDGLSKLASGKGDESISLDYGAEPHITL